MTVEHCTTCADIAWYQIDLTLYDKREEVTESVQGWYCKQHFLERLTLIPGELGEIMRRFKQ